MPNPQEIAEAKQRVKKASHITGQICNLSAYFGASLASSITVQDLTSEILIILAALEAAEKQIDTLKTSCAAKDKDIEYAEARATRAEARCRELECVGNLLRHTNLKNDTVMIEAEKEWDKLMEDKQ